WAHQRLPPRFIGCPVSAENTARLVVVAEGGTAPSLIADLVLGADLAVRCATSASDSGGGSLAGLVELAVPGSKLGDVDTLLTESLDPSVHLVLDVHERRIAQYERHWDLGAPTPGDRIVGLVVRAPALS